MIVEKGRIFFCDDAATTELYTLSLQDALPIADRDGPLVADQIIRGTPRGDDQRGPDRPPLMETCQKMGGL